jgi:hypothetical protein
MSRHRIKIFFFPVYLKSVQISIVYFKNELLHKPFSHAMYTYSISTLSYPHIVLTSDVRTATIMVLMLRSIANGLVIVLSFTKIGPMGRVMFIILCK